MPSVMYRLVFVFFQTFVFFSRVISCQRGDGEDGYGALARYNTPQAKPEPAKAAKKNTL